MSSETKVKYVHRLLDSALRGIQQARRSQYSACATLVGRDFGDWAKQVWPRVSDDVLVNYP